MAGIWGTVKRRRRRAVDARLDALAATVCDKDPRTHEQRRADAIGAAGTVRGDAGVPMRTSRLPGTS